MLIGGRFSAVMGTQISYLRAVSLPGKFDTELYDFYQCFAHPAGLLILNRYFLFSIIYRFEMNNYSFFCNQHNFFKNLLKSFIFKCYVINF